MVDGGGSCGGEDVGMEVIVAGDLSGDDCTLARFVISGLRSTLPGRFVPGQHNQPSSHSRGGQCAPFCGKPVRCSTWGDRTENQGLCTGPAAAWKVVIRLQWLLSSRQTYRSLYLGKTGYLLEKNIAVMYTALSEVLAAKNVGCKDTHLLQFRGQRIPCDRVQGS